MSFVQIDLKKWLESKQRDFESLPRLDALMKIPDHMTSSSSEQQKSVLAAPLTVAVAEHGVRHHGRHGYDSHYHCF